MFRKVWKKLFSVNVDYSQEVWYNNNIKNKKEKIDMTNLAQVIATYKGKTFKVANDKINQLERNAFKSAFVEALSKDLAEAGITVGAVDKGFAVLVDNDQLGSLTVVLDGVVKNLDYDFSYEVDAEIARQADKADKARKLAERKSAKA